MAIPPPDQNQHDLLNEMNRQMAMQGMFGSVLSPYSVQRQSDSTKDAIDTLRADNDLLRRDVQSLRADLQQMLEADARRHEADRDRANQRVGIANLTLNMFEAFEVAMRDLITSINGLPRTDAQATYHPALNSLYNNLQVIHTSLIELRRTIHQDL